MKEGTYNHLKLDNFPSLCNESGSKNKKRMTMESQYKENVSPNNHQLMNKSDGSAAVLSSPGSSPFTARIPLSNQSIVSNGCPGNRSRTNPYWIGTNVVPTLSRTPASSSITSTRTPLTHTENSANGFSAVFNTPLSSSVTPGRRPLSNISNHANGSPASAVFLNTPGSSSAPQGRNSCIGSAIMNGQYSKSPLHQIRSYNTVHPPFSSNTFTFVVGDSHGAASFVTESPPTIPCKKPLC